jgi:arylsulfatase A-like enzyme
MTGGPTSPNLVVVVLDGARAINFAGNGGDRIARTPAIDRLRQEGTGFSHAIAPGNWTLPSHMSMLTSTLPWVHRLRTFRTGTSHPPTIASWLRDRGYATGVFTEEVHLIAGYGLEDGYDFRFCPVPALSDEDRTITNRLFGHSKFLYSESVRRLMARLPPAALPITAPNFRAETEFKRTVTSDRTVESFGRWLGALDRSRPFHALLNFVDPHEPYDLRRSSEPAGPVARRYASVPRFYLLAVPEVRDRVPWKAVEASYLESLADVDRKVARVREILEQASMLDHTLVVVTSDHGQSFGEGGNIYHGCGATDSVLRIPLIIRPPEGIDVPRSVDRWVGVCDLASWLKATALGLPPYDAGGFATLPFPAVSAPAEPVLAEGGPASDPNLSLASVTLTPRWNHRLIAAYRGREKYVLDLVAGDVRVWAAGSNPDRDAPQQLLPAEMHDVLETVFGFPDPKSLMEDSDRGTGPRRAPLEDRRMRSWGYD